VKALNIRDRIILVATVGLAGGGTTWFIKWQRLKRSWNKQW